ncbi:MAG: universal stress protein [Anaerolineales bacterium]
MNRILCATRGGEESISAQYRAIQLAKERGAELVFIYVADSSFLDRSAASIVVDIQDELSKMGEFFLTMAVERADASGVVAESVIRVGVFRNELIRAAKELDASLIVLGKPGGRINRQGLADFEAFKKELGQETGAEVVSL